MKRLEQGQGIIEYGLIAILIIVVVIVVGSLLLPTLHIGGPGPYAIKDAYLRDTVFGVESRQNGAAMVWFTHDDVGVYCTLNATLSEKIIGILQDTKHPAEVVVHYATINNNDPEFPGLFATGAGCSEAGSSNQSATIYKLISVDAVNASVQ